MPSFFRRRLTRRTHSRASAPPALTGPLAEALEPRFLLTLPITDKFVDSTSWPRSFYEELGEENLGYLNGFRMQNGAAGEDELPWTNLNRVSLQFGGIDPINVDQADLLWSSGAGINYGVSDFVYNPLTRLATWTFDTPLGNYPTLRRTGDRIFFTLNGDPPDGVNVPGGDYHFVLNVVPGDANRDGNVSPTDYGTVRSAIGRNTLDEGTSPNHYTVFKDVNANGNVSPTDVGIVRGNTGANLQLVPTPQWPGLAASIAAGEPAPTSPPPRVLAAYVSGSTWSQSFKDYLQSERWGSAAYGFETHPDPGIIFGWVNLDRISVKFSSDMDVGPEDLRVRGLGGREYPVSDFHYDFDAANFQGTATWTIGGGGFIRPDRLVAVVNADPETGGVVQRTSRAPLAPGDYVLDMYVVPGNTTGIVTPRDFYTIRSMMFRSVEEPGTGYGSYSPFKDLDGNGRIGVTDLAHVRRRMYDRLPRATASPAPLEPSMSSSVTADLFSATPILA